MIHYINSRNLAALIYFVIFLILVFKGIKIEITHKGALEGVKINHMVDFKPRTSLTIDHSGSQSLYISGRVGCPPY